MSVRPKHVDAELPLTITRHIDAICDEFEAALRLDGSLILAPYVDRIEAAGREQLVEELVPLALSHLKELGALNPIADLLEANPVMRDALNSFVQASASARTISHSDGNGSFEKTSGLVVHCPHCHNTIDL